jgi:GTP-binding protein
VLLTRSVSPETTSCWHCPTLQVDRPSATAERCGLTESSLLDLFISLGASDDQLDFPLLYASAREVGRAPGGEPEHCQCAEQVMPVAGSFTSISGTRQRWSVSYTAELLLHTWQHCLSCSPRYAALPVHVLLYPQGWVSSALPPPGNTPPATGFGMAPLLDLILNHVPAPPEAALHGPFAMSVAMIERDNYGR